jgi:SAM-dependent methyltransferase
MLFQPPRPKASFLFPNYNKKDALDKQLETIRKAYDLTVEQHGKGINPLDDVPEEIKNSPFYKSLLSNSCALNSAACDIKDYLAPRPGMRFFDAGCCANIANYRLDEWPSTYYGVDISMALIGTMKDFVTRRRLFIGGLHVADISKLPFDDSFFDIAAVIGVLEYCTLEYIRASLRELNRVLKPGARAVLDIPNQNHPYISDMVKLEEYLGRRIFVHPRSQSKNLLAPLFSIERMDDSRVMIKYFVRNLK